VIDEQELHHAVARLLHGGALGDEFVEFVVAWRRQVFHLLRARCNRLRSRLPADLHFDQAHAAIAGDAEPFVVTKTRNLCAGGFARLQQSKLGRNVDFNAVDENFRHRVRPLSRTRMDDLLRRCKWAKEPLRRSLR
jgi:hypothetical protein